MFEIGHRVYDLKYGWGKVTSINNDSLYPVVVRCDSDNKTTTFTQRGTSLASSNAIRTLYFDKPEFTDKMLSPPRWRAQKGDSYYTVGNLGSIFKNKESHDSIDYNFWLVGNYFQTEEEAKESALYKFFKRVGGVNV